MISPAIRLLQAYLSALNSRDIDAIERLCDASNLVEIPFVKPGRLVGKREIVKAHREVFANLSAIDFELHHSGADENHAIGSGRLEFTRANGDSTGLPVAIVAEASGDLLARISLYCDARNLRLWSDKTIL